MRNGLEPKIQTYKTAMNMGAGSKNSGKVNTTQ